MSTFTHHPAIRTPIQLDSLLGVAAEGRPRPKVGRLCLCPVGLVRLMSQSDPCVERAHHYLQLPSLRRKWTQAQSLVTQ